MIFLNYVMKNEYTLKSETLVTRNDQQFIISQIGDEVVMMDVNNGVYIGMNSVGSNIWKLLAEAVSVKDIVASLTNQYDVNPAQCEAETLTYLQQMLEQNMLIVRK
jgi:hypothetical protein